MQLHSVELSLFIVPRALPSRSFPLLRYLLWSYRVLDAIDSPHNVKVQTRCMYCPASNVINRGAILISRSATRLSLPHTHATTGYNSALAVTAWSAGPIGIRQVYFTRSDPYHNSGPYGFRERLEEAFLHIGDFTEHSSLSPSSSVRCHQLPSSTCHRNCCSGQPS